MFINFLKAIAPYIKYLVFGAAIVTLLLLWRSKSNQLSDLDKAMNLYKRQMSGQLTDKEHQLEAANNALGIAQSKLMTQDDLLKSYKNDNDKMSADLVTLQKKYNLELESYQHTIASLKEQIKEKGSTAVSIGGTNQSTDPKPDTNINHLINPQTDKLSYHWQSGDGRFDLVDPNVFSSGSIKTFTLHQSFVINGEVFREKAGFLKTSHLTLEEVVVIGKNSDGTPKYNVVGNAEVIESHFNYSEKSPDTWVPHKSVWGIWGVVSANFALNNGLNPRFLLGTGIEFLQYKGLGLGLQLYLDTAVWQDSGFGFMINYRPTIKNTQLNIGVNIGLATQFRQPFQSYIPMLGITLYLW